MRCRWIRLIGLVWLLPLLGCAAPALQSPGPSATEPRLADFHFVADDGYRLPLRHWPAEGNRNAVVLAVHGFNDHAGSFDVLARALSPHGIEVYAYDQRGFGTTEQRRVWAGHERMRRDATLLARQLRARYPDTPLYLVGKSMGGAIAILAMTTPDPPPVDGSVLIAPATWSRSTMPWYQRLGLWLGVRLIPQATFSVSNAHRLGIEPTDDAWIKRKLAKDPLILRSARVDTLHGLTQAMDEALAAASQLPSPTLVMYGDTDEVVPAEAFCALLKRLPRHEGVRMALYPGGYHMLTRYTQRLRTERDLIAWLLDNDAALPSGNGIEPESAQRSLCDA
ncbi:alpha/beta hydrolase [Billgrantia saliphila]|uniref:alpha/beta hydrolase n=1 Tax=Billgrantia saliphila TaxID=1848458 RepID=UPI000CE4C37F|nr:alpha/beta hydrolase [Halomonas saliphila]